MYKEGPVESRQTKQENDLLIFFHIDMVEVGIWSKSTQITLEIFQRLCLKKLVSFSKIVHFML